MIIWLHFVVLGTFVWGLHFGTSGSVGESVLVTLSSQIGSWGLRLQRCLGVFLCSGWFRSIFVLSRVCLLLRSLVPLVTTLFMAMSSLASKSVPSRSNGAAGLRKGVASPELGHSTCRGHFRLAHGSFASCVGSLAGQWRWVIVSLLSRSTSARGSLARATVIFSRETLAQSVSLVDSFRSPSGLPIRCHMLIINLLVHLAYALGRLGTLAQMMFNFYALALPILLGFFAKNPMPWTSAREFGPFVRLSCQRSLSLSVPGTLNAWLVPLGVLPPFSMGLRLLFAVLLLGLAPGQVFRFSVMCLLSGFNFPAPATSITVGDCWPLATSFPTLW